MKQIQFTLFLSFFVLLLFSPLVSAYEINASPFATSDTPLPQYIKSQAEKLILVDPNENVWGAYNRSGKLIRWGIATTGADWCSDLDRSCRTKSGTFRIYSIGNENCVSYQFPLNDNGGAPMPYCMYFNHGMAIHGAYEVTYGNASHGCVRIHIDDAKWLRYHFVEGPKATNKYRGTKVIVRAYENYNH